MNKIIVVIMCLFLSGCGIVTSEKWKVCEKLCQPNGGVKSVDSNYVNGCVCNNNAYFY